MPLNRVFLGLGSNIERERHLQAGLDALAGLLVDLRCSPVFESAAVGQCSGYFYNLAVSGLTELPLAELDRRLKAIEADNGRYASGRRGLPLDIDVLLFAQLVGDFEGLRLPRAEILHNAFVLWPLALLAPDARHPLDGRCFAQLWQASSIEQVLWPVPFCWRGQQLTPPALCRAYPPPR